jgi:hypothetical protein
VSPFLDVPEIFCGAEIVHWEEDGVYEWVIGEDVSHHYDT